MKNRLNVVYGDTLCWSVVEIDGKYYLEYPKERFGNKEISAEHKDALIKMTIDTYSSLWRK